MDQTGCIINQPIFFFSPPLVNLPVMGKQKPRSCVCLPDPWWCMCVFFFPFSPSLFWSKCCDLKVTPALLSGLLLFFFCLRSSCALPSKNLSGSEQDSRMYFWMRAWPGRAPGRISSPCSGFHQPFSSGACEQGWERRYQSISEMISMLSTSPHSPAGSAGAVAGFLCFSQAWVERANPSGWQGKGTAAAPVFQAKQRSELGQSRNFTPLL